MNLSRPVCVYLYFTPFLLHGMMFACEKKLKNCYSHWAAGNYHRESSCVDQAN